VKHLLELGAVLGQLVDHGRGGRRQFAPPHDAGGLELAQARGEHVRADAREAEAQVRVALGPAEQLADDQQRPPLADQ
jgi:hypothetical protein